MCESIEGMLSWGLSTSSETLIEVLMKIADCARDIPSMFIVFESELIYLFHYFTIITGRSSGIAFRMHLQCYDQSDRHML